MKLSLWSLWLPAMVTMGTDWPHSSRVCLFWGSHASQEAPALQLCRNLTAKCHCLVVTIFVCFCYPT